jgi:hypothetical protein
MKKLTYLLIVLGVAGFATSASAQAYGPYGTGNVARNVTQANPEGIYRYPFSTNESGMSAFAKAPAVKSKSKSKAVVPPQPWELR